MIAKSYAYELLLYQIDSSQIVDISSCLYISEQKFSVPRSFIVLSVTGFYDTFINDPEFFNGINQHHQVATIYLAHPAQNL